MGIAKFSWMAAGRILAGALLLACLAMTDAWAAKPYCGDNKCTGGETPENCPEDCGEPPPPDVCGDGFCTGSETFETCPEDCGARHVVKSRVRGRSPH